jgi:hypothetical protein
MMGESNSCKNANACPGLAARYTSSGMKYELTPETNIYVMSCDAAWPMKILKISLEDNICVSKKKCEMQGSI